MRQRSKATSPDHNHVPCAVWLYAVMCFDPLHIEACSGGHAMSSSMLSAVRVHLATAGLTLLQLCRLTTMAVGCCMIRGSRLWAGEAFCHASKPIVCRWKVCGALAITGFLTHTFHRLQMEGMCEEARDSQRSFCASLASFAGSRRVQRLAAAQVVRVAPSATDVECAGCV